MRDSDYKPQDEGIDQFQKDKRRRRTVTVEAVTRSPRVERTENQENYEQTERPVYKPRETMSEGGYRSREESHRPQGEYTPRGEYQSRGGYKPQGERRSYNPNFSADNKFVGGDRQQKPERDFNRWDSSSPERKPYGDRKPYNSGERRPYNNDGQPRPYGERKPYDGERRPYTPRPAGDRPAYGQQRGNRPGAPGGKPYGARPGGNKPYGNKKQFGYKKPFVKREGGGMDPGAKPDFYPSYNSTTDTTKELRLNRYIAMCGKCSRREADEFIVGGHVMVNGDPVTELGVKILPTDKVYLKGELLSNERKVYIIMNKPKGFVTSVDDPHADKTVMDIVRNACTERIYPVGRLDKSSVGVLLLTNDGDLTEKLTHPSHNKKKIYQVTLERPLTNMDLQRARDGIDLDDGVIIPDAVDFVKPDNRKEVGIEIHSGRNRIVRRIFEELGYGVHKLDRVYFAGLTKKNLKRGQWRFLTEKELGMLKSGRYE